MNQKKLVALKIIDVLERGGFKAYLAGGCVRDELLNRKISDFDIATSALPDQVMLLAKQECLKFIPTGVDHGTVTIISAGTPIEVTTFRRDVKTDGRHAVVEYTGATLETDAGRRDFTVNAMFMDKDGHILDFHKGREDLANGILRFVGDPEHRIREDYLRILRLLRFWAQLNLTPEENSLKAARRMADGLTHLSRERVTSEVLKLLSCTPCQKPLVDLLSFLFPNSDPLALNIDDIHCANVELQSVARLWVSLLTISRGEIADARAKCDTLVLSNTQKDWITTLANAPSMLAHIQDQSDAMDFLDELEESLGHEVFKKELVPMILMTIGANAFLNERLKYCCKIEQKLAGLRRSSMPIAAADLMDTANIPQGPAIGEKLRELKRLYRLEYWTTKEEGMRLING